MLNRRIPPEISHFSEIFLQPEEIISLPNGIDLHLVNYGSLPVSRLSLIWDGGVLDFPHKAPAAVMGATIQEATALSDGKKVADLIDFCGARVGGGTSDHFTSLEMVAINSSFDRLLPLILEFATQAAFPENAVEATAKRMAANRMIQLEKVSFLASERLHALMQGTCHPASVTAMPAEFEVVDRSIVAPLYDVLKSSRLHIYAGGMISEGLVKSIADTFSEIPRAKGSMVDIIPYEPEAPERVHIRRPESVQSAVAMGLPTIGRDNPDYIPLRLAVMALGGYFGSRLMTNIREEKGLTYGINAVQVGTREGAYTEITAQCDSRYVDDVVDETVKEIENLAANPPRGDELERLRLNAWTRLATSADTVFGTLEHYITALKVGTPHDYFRRQLDEIARLTPDTIARVAAEHLSPGRLSIVTAGA